MIFRKIKKFIKIDTKKKVSFIKAYIYTGIARAFILFVPFNKLKKQMGQVKVESDYDLSDDIYAVAREVRWAVTKASIYTPWESKCLVQALAAQRMLKEKGIKTTLYLGVGKGNKNEMLAHAWIRCGSYIVTGGANKDEFAVVAKFTSI